MNDRFRQPLYWILFAGYCGVLVWSIYGASLALPFFFDDFVHYPFVEANDVVRIWRTTDELAYYRPLNFTLWRITYDIFLEHNAAVDHAINLILHAANGLMVGWLATCLWSMRGDRFPVVARDEERADWWRVLLSATLFLLFPFSYQAVPWVGSLSHLLVTSLVLLSVLFYVQMRRTRSSLWGAASLAAAFAAPFAHENGVLVMPLLVCVDLTTPGLSRPWRRALRTGLLWSLPLLLYVPIWLSLPRLSDGRLFDNSVEGMLQNTAYFVQGVFYPLTGLGGWLHYRQGVNDMFSVALLSGLGFAVAATVQLARRATLRSWLPWLWIGLTSLPAILFLVFEYVINGPRLLMLASVGVAWLWSDVILLFSRGGKRGSPERTVRVALAGALTVLVLPQNVRFLQERMAMHELLGAGFAQVITAAVEANAAGQEPVVVNFPSWLSPKRAVYALGHEGVLFWPDYVPPEIFMAVHTGELGDLNFIRADGIRPELEDYYYGLTGPAPDWQALSAVPAQFLRTDYAPGSLELTPVGELGNHLQEQVAPAANFAGQDGTAIAQLLDARTLPVDGGMQVETLWQATALPPHTTLFVHVVDSAGNLVAQADGDPLGGIYPMDQWPGNGRVLDRRLLELQDLSGLEVRVGLYDRLSGSRLVASDPEGRPYADNAVPLAGGTP